MKVLMLQYCVPVVDAQFSFFVWMGNMHISVRCKTDWTQQDPCVNCYRQAGGIPSPTKYKQFIK